MIIIVDFQL